MHTFILSIVNWMLSKKIFIVRFAIFFIALTLTVIGRDIATTVFMFELFGQLRVYHILWGFVLLEMLLVFIPKLNHFTGCGKIYKKNYIPRQYHRAKLQSYTRRFNMRAVYSFLIWIGTLLGLRLLALEKYWIFMVSFLYYFLDQLFVNVWCPFKSWIIKNRCCATCRIYNWGFPIIMSPLIFIPSFWTYSLVALSIAVFLQWEILHMKHPERFSELSNAGLSCAYCNTKCNRSMASGRIES